MTWIRAPEAAIRAIRPEQPIASSSACGARTSAEPGSSDTQRAQWPHRLREHMRAYRLGVRADVVVVAVERGRLADQLVQAQLRLPAHRSRGAEDRQLLE